MKKRGLVLCIMFIAIMIFLRSDVKAQSASGTCGEDITWTLRSDGSLTITGSGAMTDFGEIGNQYVSIPWSSFSDSIKTITIDGNIEHIGSDAFQGLEITSITLPDGVISIGEGAFSYCKSLSSIIIPESVTHVGSDAFKNCTELKDVYYQGTLSEWCKIIFDNENSVPVPTYFPADLYIDGELLSGEITIPNDVISIGNYTFKSCSNLTSVTISNSVTSIGKGAFSYCWNLSEIIISDNVTSIGESAFMLCGSLTDIIIPNNVTSIGEKAFCSCDALTSIEIPDSVISMGKSAFDGCLNLTDVKLSGNMTRIEEKTFYACRHLKNVIIPESITYIGPAAFCLEFGEKLKYIFYGGTVSQWNSIDIVYSVLYNNDFSNTFIHYSAADHIWNSDYTIDIESTCAVTGSKSIHCSVCDLVKEDSSILIPMNENHITELRDKREATYVSTGYTGDQVCNVCGKVIQSGTIIPVKERTEALGKFALLKSFLQEKGQTDEDGNKYFQETLVLSVNLGGIATITYVEDEAKFKFYYEHLEGKTVQSITLYLEEAGSQTVTVDYSTEALPLNASATFNVLEYTRGGKVYFEMTSESILGNSKIQDLCNGVLKEAFSGWDVVFVNYFGLEMNMADMGFAFYEQAGTHMWDSGRVTKEATTMNEGEKTYTCIVCNEIKTEVIPKLTESAGVNKDSDVTNNNGANNKVKKTQNIQVATSKKISAKKVAKKAQSFKLSARSTSGNKVTYKLTKKNKNVKFAVSSGKITVRKGTKKGTYKIKVKMTVSGNDAYHAYSTTKTIKIKVK